jgi:hypothetical protein
LQIPTGPAVPTGLCGLESHEKRPHYRDGLARRLRRGLWRAGPTPGTPLATLAIAGNEQIAGLGSYCWTDQDRRSCVRTRSVSQLVRSCRVSVPVRALANRYSERGFRRKYVIWRGEMSSNTQKNVLETYHPSGRFKIILTRAINSRLTASEAGAMVQPITVAHQSGCQQSKMGNVG